VQGGRDESGDGKRGQGDARCGVLAPATVIETSATFGSIYCYHFRIYGGISLHEEPTSTLTHHRHTTVHVSVSVYYYYPLTPHDDVGNLFLNCLTIQRTGCTDRWHAWCVQEE
jgi:hypothetical protein